MPRPILLLTRPRTDSERFVASLSRELQEAVEPVIAPLLEIRETAAKIDTTGVRGLIFSSRNGVLAASALVTDRSLPAYCVGAKTTDAASREGWSAQFCGENADQLVERLIEDGIRGPLLHLRGHHTRGDIDGRLTASGCTTRAAEIYDQFALPFGSGVRKIFHGDRPIIAPLFSPRTAELFLTEMGGTAPVWVIALSEAVAKPLQTQKNVHLVVADHPTAGAVRAALGSVVTQAARVEGGPGAH